MSMNDEKIYESPASCPDDEFWLGQGRKMVEDSLKAVHEASKSLMTGIGLLKGIYLAILGFTEFIPERFTFYQKGVFLLPILMWLLALYCFLRVMMPDRYDVNLFSPEDIRSNHGTILLRKHRYMYAGFWALSLGIIITLVLLIYRFSL